MDAAATWDIEDSPYALIPHELIEDLNLPHTAIRVYGYLMRRAENKTKEAFPGYRLIGKEIGMSTATVSNGIKSLEDRGWIDVTRTTVKGERKANHYFVRRTRRVLEIDTPVADSDTGGVSEIEAELDSLSLTRLTELETPRTQMKNALVNAMGWNPTEVTSKQWAKVEVAAKDLCNINADPADVPYRSQVYQVNFRGATMTPIAIASNWADLATPRAPLPQSEVEKASNRQRRQQALEAL